MFEDLLETRDGGAVLGRGAVSTALLAHGIVLFVLVAASMLAFVSPGDGKVPDPFPPFVPPLPVLLGDNPDAGIRKGTRAPAPPVRKQTFPKREESARPEPVQPRAPEPLPAPEKDPPPPGTPPVPDPTTAPLPDETGGAGSTAGEGPFGDPEGRGEGDSGTGTGKGKQGVPWGVPDGQPGTEQDILIPGPTVTRPILIRRVEPVYPQLAIRTRTEGTVILQGIIGTDGRVESLIVLRSHRMLDEAALSAVREWLYAPARHQGRPVKVYLTIRVEFELN
jgi:protein TonB